MSSPEGETLTAAEPPPAVPPEPDALRAADAPEPGADAPPSRPGATTFTIEGRSAPALFVVGWIATILGLGAVVIALLGGANPAAPVLLIVGLVVLSLGLVAGAGSQAIERRARGVSAYQGPSPFLVFAASVPLAGLAGIILAIPLVVAGVPVDSPVGRLIGVATQAVVYVVLLRLLVVDLGALHWADMGVTRLDRQAVAGLVTGAMWALPVIVITGVVATILTQLVPVTPTSPLPPTGDAAGLVINLIAGALIAPVAEELLFRGFATTAWARTIGAQRALVRAALFFAVVHVLNISGTEADQAIGLAIVGFASRIPVALALGWLYLRGRSIWAPIGLHAAFNGALIVLGEIALRSGVA